MAARVMDEREYMRPGGMARRSPQDTVDALLDRFQAALTVAADAPEPWKSTFRSALLDGEAWAVHGTEAQAEPA